MKSIPTTRRQQRIALTVFGASLVVVAAIALAYAYLILTDALVRS